VDEAELERAALDQGWTVERTKRGHRRFVPPDPTRRIVIGSGTPGDRRAIRNLLAQLRRESLVWPWPPTKGGGNG
jgi:predicted RNA binding protein YcfA (HicA-like mRNA interferase family)